MSLVSEEELTQKYYGLPEPEVKYEGRERKSALTEFAESIPSDVLTIRFVKILTLEQANNVRTMMRTERRKTLKYQAWVDFQTFQPILQFFAVRAGESLLEAPKFSVLLDDDTADFVTADYTNVSAMTDAVLKVLANTHTIESEDYKFAGIITKTADDIVIPDAEADEHTA